MSEITDRKVLRKSSQKYHPVLMYCGNAKHEVEGILFEVRNEEIIQADAYEVNHHEELRPVF